MIVYLRIVNISALQLHLMILSTRYFTLRMQDVIIHLINVLVQLSLAVHKGFYGLFVCQQIRLLECRAQGCKVEYGSHTLHFVPEIKFQCNKCVKCMNSTMVVIGNAPSRG